jgi:hypothetical protein
MKNKNTKCDLTLCEKCHRDYGYVPNQVLMLVSRSENNICSKCKSTHGWDYDIVEKERWAKK